MPGEPTPLRASGFIAAALGFAALVLLFSVRGHLALTPLLAPLCLGCAVLGVLYGLGTFDDAGPVRSSVDARTLLRPAAALLVSALGLWLALRMAVAARWPQPVLTSAIAIPLLALATLTAACWLWLRVSAAGPSRPLLRREGFWLLSIGIVLYLPLLGSYSLIDPWETHYGEVARALIARDDWISLWWAQENWFWSKPALTFWLEGLSFIALGVRWEPDAMLAGVKAGYLPAPEWAVRLPAALLSLVAVYLAYRAVACVAGRRAGFLSGLVLLSVPYWSLIAHQGMTDMPYAATLSGGLALALLGLHCDAEQRVALYELRFGARALRISGAQLVLGLVLLSSLPQLAYLVSRHMTFVLEGADTSFTLHRDYFFSGSGAGNCGLPGNEICEPGTPASPEFQPLVAALVWGACLGALAWAQRGERRVKRLSFLAAWFAIALSILGKGAPGAVLGLLVPVVALCARKRFRELARLELPSLVLLTACVALPWYVQAFARHGAAFTDRLLFYDMYKRAFVHVHDTNGSDDVSLRYYLWQLAYGLFPFSAFAGFALLSSFGQRDEAHDAESGHRVYLGLWFLLAFSMFSVSLTKFHHYALPAAPPLALLSGMLLDRMLGKPLSPALSAARSMLSGVAWLGCAALFVAGVASLIPGSFWGSAANPELAPRALLGAVLLAGAVASGVCAARLAPCVTAVPPSERYTYAVDGVVLLTSAAGIALIGRDFVAEPGRVSQGRLLDLFSYNYTREWPRTLDFRTAPHAFLLCALLLLALAVVPRLRPYMLRAFVCLGPLFCAFCLNVYLVRVAPHWGQRENVLAYYAARSGPEEPLVAYQMNWKGENFYTGNRLPAFVSSGDKFKDFLREHRAHGTRVLFFTTEHARIGSLKSELGRVKRFELITSPQHNNKFFVARVEL